MNSITIFSGATFRLLISTFLFLSLGLRAQLPYFESFTGSAASGVNIFEDAELIGTSIRLTSTGSFNRGYIVGEQVILPAGGLEIEFEFCAFGGVGDGMTFFLFDGNTPSDPASGFQIGAPGGALGYAQRFGGVNGVSNAYLGIGIDPFGNFSVAGEGRQGGPGRRENSVTLRGAGNGSQQVSHNYPFLITNRISGFSLISSSLSFDPTNSNYRKCNIKLKPRLGPGFDIDVTIFQGDPSGTLIEHKFIEDYSYTSPSPPALKYGFAATTGSASMNFDVRNLSIEAFDASFPGPEPRDIKITTCQDEAVDIDIQAYTSAFGCPLNCFNQNSFDLDPSDVTTTVQNVVITGQGEFDYDISTGILTFSPEVSFTGTSTIDFSFKDAFGNQSSIGEIEIVVSSTGNCSDLELDITVSNEKPTVGNTVTFTVTVTNNGPSDATDVEVPIELLAGYSNITPGTASAGTFNTTDNKWEIPALNVSVTQTFQISADVQDNNLPLSFRSIVTSTAVNHVDPVPINDTADGLCIAFPIIRADANAAFVDESVQGDLSTNDAFNDKPTYGDLTASAANPTGASIGLNSDGTYTFSAGEVGRYSYAYEACEGSSCWEDSLVIFVTNPELSSGNPVIVFPDFAVLQGARDRPFARRIKVATNDLAASFLGEIDESSLTIVTPPNKGTATVLDGGRIRYEPDDDTYGFDILEYQICDEDNNCGLGYLYVHILEPGDVSLTVASDNIYRTQQGRILTVNTDRGLRNNDMAFPFFYPFTELISGPTGGGNNISVLNNGSFTFTPNSTFNATSTFTYESCSDGECAEATARVMAAPGYYWTGNVSSVWNNDDNWMPSVPGASDVATIPEVDISSNHYTSLSGDRFDIASLVLRDNSELTVQNNAGLQVGENLINDGTITLESDADGYGQLRFLVSYRGDGIVKQQMHIEGEGWRNVSAPFENLDAGVFGEVGTDRHPNAQNLFGWNTSIYNYENVPDNDAPLVHGKGYFAYFGTNGVQTGSGPWTLEIEGRPRNTVTYSNALEYTVANDVPGSWDDFVPGRGDDGWVLVGNPFTCSFNFGGLNAGGGSSVLNNAFYIWNPMKSNGNGDRYEFYSGGGISDPFVAPMQGFWVQTRPSLTGTANFGVNMSNHGSIRLGGGRPDFFRSANDSVDFDRIVLRTIAYGDSSSYDYTVVALIDSTSDGYDPDWDAHKMFNGPSHPNIYSRDSTGYFLAVNAIDYGADRGYSRTLPISFNASNHLHPYSIYLDDSYLINHYSVYLEDLKTDEFHNLSSEGAYTFTYDSLYEDRFMLHFQSLSFNIEHQLPQKKRGINAWTHRDVLYLNSEKEVVTDIEIVSANGQRVYSTRENNHLYAEVDLPSLSSGVYLIRLKQGGNHKVLKYVVTQ